MVLWEKNSVYKIKGSVIFILYLFVDNVYVFIDMCERSIWRVYE